MRNQRILPLNFVDPADYDKVDEGDNLEIYAASGLFDDSVRLVLHNKTKDVKIPVACDVSPREWEILIEGGLLNYTRKQNG